MGSGISSSSLSRSKLTMRDCPSASVSPSNISLADLLPTIDPATLSAEDCDALIGLVNRRMEWARAQRDEVTATVT